MGITNHSAKAIWYRVKGYYIKYSSVRFFTTLLCVTLLYIIMYCCYGAYFVTGDDTEMMKNVSGYYTGKPSSYCQFLSTPLGFMYKILYSWCPYTSWYSLFHVGSIIFCVSIITHEIIEHLLHKKKFIFDNIYTKIGSLSFVICCLAVIFAYPFYMLSFTVTAAFYAIAAVMVLLSIIRTEAGALSYWKFAGCFILLTMSSLLRYESFKAVLPFFVLVFGYFVLLCRKKWNKRMMVGVVLLLAVTISLIYGIKKWDRYYKDNVVESKSFVQMRKNRSYFSDLLTLPYEGNEEFFESMGWDEDLYNVTTNNWMYLDRRFNAENLEKIVAENESQKTSRNLIDGIKDAAKVFKGSTWIDRNELTEIKKKTSKLIAYITLACLAGCIYVWKRKKKYLLNIVFLFGINLLSFTELFYLCYLGRFIFRSFLCAALPALCIDLYFFISILSMLLKHFKDCEINIFTHNDSSNNVNSHNKLVRVNTLIVFVCVVTSLYFLNVMTDIVFDKENVLFRVTNTEKTHAVEEYCKAHPENYYMNDGVGRSDRSVFMDMKESLGLGRNLWQWGGPEVYTKSFYDAINAFGYSEFYTETLLEDNVFFLTTIADMSSSNFMRYMRAAYGKDVQFYLSDVICDGVYVYKFLRLQKSDSFFSDKLLSDDTYLLSSDDNLNNSEFAAHLRAAYGNSANCESVKTTESGLYVYKIVVEDELEMMLSSDTYYLTNTDIDQDPEGNDVDQNLEVLENIQEVYDESLSYDYFDSINDNIVIYKFKR